MELFMSYYLMFLREVVLVSSTNGTIIFLKVNHDIAKILELSLVSFEILYGL
jgi:hypothetical protein